MIYKVDSVGFVTVDLDRGDLLQFISLLVVSVCLVIILGIVRHLNRGICIAMEYCA